MAHKHTNEIDGQLRTKKDTIHNVYILFWLRVNFNVYYRRILTAIANFARLCLLDKLCLCDIIRSINRPISKCYIVLIWY